MKKSILLIVGMSASLAFSAVYDVSDVADIAASYGNDTFRYTGATDASAAPLALAPSAATQATTISVVQPDAELALSGSLTIAHLFFKTGPGILKLAPAGGGNVTWANEGSCYNMPSPPVSWDNGAATGMFMGFNVSEGTLKWSGSGTLSGYNLTVGNCLEAGPKPASLELTNGKLQLDNLLILGQGNSLAGNTAQSSLVVGTGAQANIETIWSIRSPNEEKWDGRSLVDVAGGLLNVVSHHWLGYGRGTATLRVREGGTYEQRSGNVSATKDYSLKVGSPSLRARGVVEVYGANSKLIADRLNCEPGWSTVAVTNGGTLAVQSPTRDAVRSKALGGSLFIDGGTICSSTNGVEAEWFPYGERHTVGAQGGVVTTRSIASLGGWLSGVGTLTKNGSGHVTMMPSAAPVHVAEGSVGFHVVQCRADDAERLGEADATVTVALGAEARALGPQALGAMTLQSGAGSYAFGTAGEDHDADPSAWAFVNAAHPRTDGWFCLTDARVKNKAGAVWRTAKVPVNQSFEISVDYFATKVPQETGYLPFGVAMVWQNDGTNVQKISSSSARALGYAKSDMLWTNSFALGYDAAGSTLRVSHDDGAGGHFLVGDDDAELTSVFAISGSSFVRPVTLVARYDRPNQKMTFTVRSGNGTSWTHEVTNLDLAAKCGADEAYFGLTASDWHRDACQGEHFVGNIRLSTAAPAVETFVGGHAAIAAGSTFRANLAEDSFNKCWSMARVVHGDGAILNVTGPADATLRFSAIEGTGRLEKTGAAGLGLGNRFGMMPGTLRLSDGSLTLEAAAVEDFAADISHWKFSSAEAGSFPSVDTISVGRAVSVNEIFYDNVTLRRPIDISKKWTLSWHGKFHAVSAFASQYMSVILHNDPRGAAACGTDYGASHGITNSVTVAWQAKSQDNYGTGKAYLFKGADSDSVAEESYASVIDMMVGAKEEEGYADKEVDFTLSYDPATTTLTFKMQQDEQVFTLTPQQVDLSQTVGDRAYLAFGISTKKWFSVNHQISDLRFTYDDPGDVPYVSRLELNAVDSRVALNTADSGRVFKLAETVVVADDASLVLSSKDAPAVATAGRVECSGMATQGGGTFLIGPDTLSGVKSWGLADDAKLMVPTGVKAQVPELWNGSERVQSGIYTSGSASFVVGGGKLKVGSGGGVIVILR